MTLFLVGTYEGVHTQHVYFVIARQTACLVHPIPEPVIVDDTVAANETCQIKGVAGAYMATVRIFAFLLILWVGICL